MKKIKGFSLIFEKKLFGLLTVLLLLLPHGALGAGLTVEPGGLLIQKVPVGEVYDLSKETGIVLKIHNRIDSARTYRISAQKPSAAGSGQWTEGYQEIPDPGILSFDKSDVTIEPQGIGEVRLYLKIPEYLRYYNQHWAVTVAVEGQPAPGELFALAAYPLFEIETVSRNGIGEKPWGKIGVEPSSLILKATEKGKIKIYNNEDKGHKYSLRIDMSTDTSSTRQIGLSPGYRNVPEVGWIDMSHKELAIKRDGVQEVSLTARLPDKPSPSGPWEAILWVESDSGEKAFIRLDIEQ